MSFALNTSTCACRGRNLISRADRGQQVIRQEPERFAESMICRPNFALLRALWPLVTGTVMSPSRAGRSGFVG